MAKIRVVVWNENVHERTHEAVRKVYPKGIHGAIAGAMGKHKDMAVTCATLDMSEHGLTQKVLDATDVLIWWGHMAHDQVQDAVVDRVHQRVLRGMGIICLHSAHFSKIFHRLCGTTCQLKWREAAEREVLWVTRPGHEILQGINDCFVIPQEEMYGEHFDIPEPDETILISSFAGGEVFRSGCTWRRGAGKVFYFRPGHETYPTYYQTEVLQVIANAVRWARPAGSMAIEAPNKPEFDWFVKGGKKGKK